MINPQVIKKPLKSNCLLIASIIAIYSAFVVDNATVDYRIKRQLTGAWANVKTYPVVDRQLSKSLA